MSIQVQHIHTCTGHNGALYALAQGQSPRHFLSAGSDGWVVEWQLDDPEMGKLVASVENQVFSLADLPDSNRLVAGNMNGGMHWVNRANPEQTRNLQFHQKGYMRSNFIKGLFLAEAVMVFLPAGMPKRVIVLKVCNVHTNLFAP